MYQMLWAFFIITVSINATIYFMAPTFLCPKGIGNCGFLQIAEKGLSSTQNMAEIKETLQTTQSGSQAGTTSTTPPGFWNYLSGNGQQQQGLLGQGLTTAVSFVFGFQLLSLYFANSSGVPIFVNMIWIFISIFSAIQAVGITYFIIYVAGLIRGVKA